MFFSTRFQRARGCNYGIPRLSQNKMKRLLNCEDASLTVFATKYLKEQQTSDNLIVKDYCFIIEIFDKFSFSGILRDI